MVNQQRCLCIEDPFDATDNVARTLTKDQVCLCLNTHACSYQAITLSRVKTTSLSQILTVAKRCALLHQCLLTALEVEGTDWSSVLASVESATAKADAKPAK